jgi:hypothetical protein
MKRSILISVLLIAGSFITLQHVAMAEPSTDLVQRVTKLAYVNDLMDDELEEVKQLRETADERFEVFAEIIQSSQDDAVINTAMSFSEYASNHRSELVEIASAILSKRENSLFPLSTQRALAVLGTSGDKKHIPQLKAFASNPQILIRTAAETALNNLKNKTGAEPTTPNQNPPPSVQAPAPNKAPTSTPSEEPTSLTPWSIIVILTVAVGGLLWLLLKRRS